MVPFKVLELDLKAITYPALKINMVSKAINKEPQENRFCKEWVFRVQKNSSKGPGKTVSLGFINKSQNLI